MAEIRHALRRLTQIIRARFGSFFVLASSVVLYIADGATIL
jgi:hypothetical protein